LLKSIEDISSTKKRLKIEIPSEIIESEIKKILIDKQKKVKMPGFRPGRVPFSIIEKKFGKDAEFEALDKIIMEFYLNSVREAKLRPVSKPVIEESSEFQKDKPLSMTIEVEVMPYLEPKYENISVKEVPYEVKEEEIDSLLKKLTEEKATYESTDDSISFGDIVTIDYKTKEDALEKNDVILKIGNGPYPKEFFDSFIGRKKEENFSVQASFPEDWDTPFAGKKVSFEIKIKEVKKRNLPALDDEFAKDLGFDNIASLKDHIKENILSYKKADADKAKQREIIDHLLETHNFDIPEALLDSEISFMINEIRAKNKKDTRSDEELKEELEDQAKKNIKISYLLELIGEKEGITVSEEEIKNEIINIAQAYYVSPKHVIDYFVAKDGSLDGIKKSIYDKKVLNLLLEKVKVEGEN
jgi:trigger factor